MRHWDFSKSLQAQIQEHKVPIVGNINDALRTSFQYMLTQRAFGNFLTSAEYDSMNDTEFKLPHLFFNSLIKDLLIENIDWKISKIYEPPILDPLLGNKRKSETLVDPKPSVLVSLDQLLNKSPRKVVSTSTPTSSSGNVTTPASQVPGISMTTNVSSVTPVLKIAKQVVPTSSSSTTSGHLSNESLVLMFKLN